MITIDAKQLKTALSRVMFAASDENKYRLNTVLFEFDCDKLVLVAADGFRLSKATITLDDAASPGSVLITLDSAKKLYKAIKRKSQVCFDAERFIVDGEHIEVETLDEKYADYEAVAPGYLPARCIVNTRELIDKLKTVFFVSERKRYNGIIKLEINNSDMLISKVGDEHISTVSANTYGEATTAFMARYLLQLLDAIKAGRVSIAFQDRSEKRLRPAEITIAGDETFVHWLMPVLIKE